MQSEIQLQAQCFQDVWNKYPQTRRCLFAVPNGGKRGVVEATQLKASGVVAGACDLIMFWKGKSYGIEMKIPGGVVSKDQKAVHEAWKAQGVDITICYTYQSFMDTINKILAI